MLLEFSTLNYFYAIKYLTPMRQASGRDACPKWKIAILSNSRWHFPHLQKKIMSKLNRVGVGRSLERILEKQPTEVQTVAAANTAQGNEMTQVALDRNDKERTEIIHRVADINFVVATIIASAAFSALIQVPGGFDNKGLANLREKINFYYFISCDSIAFFSSLLSMLIHFWAVPFRKSIETADVGFHSIFLRVTPLASAGMSLFFFAISFFLATGLVSPQTLAQRKHFKSMRKQIFGHVFLIVLALYFLMFVTFIFYRKIIGIPKNRGLQQVPRKSSL